MPDPQTAEHRRLAESEARKADAVERSLHGPITEDCPASFLRTTPFVHLYLDADAAAQIDRSQF